MQSKSITMIEAATIRTRHPLRTNHAKAVRWVEKEGEFTDGCQREAFLLASYNGKSNIDNVLQTCNRLFSTLRKPAGIYAQGPDDFGCPVCPRRPVLHQVRPAQWTSILAT